MKKTVISTANILFSIFFLILGAGCIQSADKKLKNNLIANEVIVNEQQNLLDVHKKLSGADWLKSIFASENDDGYCFPDEEKVTTNRYYDFFIETIGIYEYPMFENEDEKIAAEKKYIDKWKDIYSLDEEVEYPFGRGNGTEHGDHLEDVKITTQTETEHTIYIHFGGNYKSITEVTLVPNGNSFLIDYMKTEYVE